MSHEPTRWPRARLPRRGRADPLTAAEPDSRGTRLASADRRDDDARLVRRVVGAGGSRIDGEVRPEPEDGGELLRDVQHYAARHAACGRPGRRGGLAGEYLGK